MRCLRVCVTVCLLVSLCVCLYAYVSVSIRLFTCLLVCVCVCALVCLFFLYVYLRMCLWILSYNICLCPSPCLSEFRVPVYIFLRVCLCPFVCTLVCACLCLYVPVSVYARVCACVSLCCFSVCLGCMRLWHQRRSRETCVRSSFPRKQSNKKERYQKSPGNEEDPIFIGSAVDQSPVVISFT